MRKARPMRMCIRCGQHTFTFYCKECQDQIRKPPLAAKASWRPDWRARTADGKKWAV